MTKVKCAVTGKEMDEERAYRAGLLRKQLYDLIVSENPDVNPKSYLDPALVDAYRGKYLNLLVSEETGEVDDIEQRVISAIRDNRIIADDLHGESEKLSIGQQLADKIAAFGGSWKFIIIFGIFIVLWMGVNVFFLFNKGWDPYPFILLNLILSCLAAMQAPIIMMSQNRQAEKDRVQAEHDYMVNLKSELEIKLLHEKMDHLMVHQHMRLLEIQQIQTDYLKDILAHLKR